MNKARKAARRAELAAARRTAARNASRPTSGSIHEDDEVRVATSPRIEKTLVPKVMLVPQKHLSDHESHL